LVANTDTTRPQGVMAGERERTDRGARGKWEASGKGRLGTEMGAHVGRGDVGVGEARTDATKQESAKDGRGILREVPWKKRTDGQGLPAAKGAKDHWRQPKSIVRDTPCSTDGDDIW